MYARHYFKRLKRGNGSKHREEVAELVSYHQFKGGGQRKTPAMTVTGLQRLLKIMGDKVAPAYRDLADAATARA